MGQISLTVRNLRNQLGKSIKKKQTTQQEKKKMKTKNRKRMQNVSNPVKIFSDLFIIKTNQNHEAQFFTYQINKN